MNRLLQMENLERHYETPAGVVKALDGVSIEIYEGERVMELPWWDIKGEIYVFQFFNFYLTVLENIFLVLKQIPNSDLFLHLKRNKMKKQKKNYSGNQWHSLLHQVILMPRLN